tara:strand:+ start:1173 stop:1283 length:111 start_codon:yes stop_codon:yes gene_type:complete
MIIEGLSVGQMLKAAEMLKKEASQKDKKEIKKSRQT